MDVTWVNINKNYNTKNQPRLLTKKEILEIASQVPKPPSADVIAAEVSQKGVQEWVADMLVGEKIDPEAIPELKDMIVDQHYKSLVATGTPLIVAAEGVGSTTTQMTLNSVVPWEEIIFQDEQGVAHVVKIGEWIDTLMKENPDKIKHIPENRTNYLELDHPVKILAPDEHGNLLWDTLTAVTRHLPVGDLVHIKTKSGREVTVTQSKSLLTWDGEKLVGTNGCDVKVGDLVPVHRSVPEPPSVTEYIHLRDYLNEKEWLYGSNLVALKKQYDDYPVPGKHRFWSKEDRLTNIPYGRADSALRAIQKGIDTGKIQEGYVYPKIWIKGCENTLIPEKIVCDKQFGQIVGLYLAEGWATNTFVGISNNAKEIQELVYAWCKRIGVTYHIVVKTTKMGTSSDIKIHSVLIARWFKKWLGTGSANKIMPANILLGNKEFITGVLDGYFAGDGCVRKDGCLCISSVSKDLIIGFSFLCSRLGIFGRKSGYQQKKNNVGSKNILYAHIYTIRNKSAVRWAKRVGSCCAAKQDRLQNITLNLPCRNSWGKDYKRQKSVILDPIVSIEYVDQTEFVYDVTVPKTLNFSLLNGLNLEDTFHDSGSSRSATIGIDAMKDLIFARKELKDEYCTIRFKEHKSYEEVLHARERICGTYVSNFVKNYELFDADKLPKFWWHDTYKQLSDEDISPEDTNAEKVLRIYLDVNEMYKYKVTIQDIVIKIENTSADVFAQTEDTKRKKKSKTDVKLFVSAFSPTSIGIIDFYPREDMTQIYAESFVNVQSTGKIPRRILEEIYLEYFVVPDFKNIKVKGISGLSNLVPVVQKIFSVVHTERKIDEKNAIWSIKYSTAQMNRSGVSIENIKHLLSEACIRVVSHDPEFQRFEIGMPRDRFRTPNNQTVIIGVDGKNYYTLFEPVDVPGKKKDHYYVQTDNTNWRETEGGWFEDIGNETIFRSKRDIVVVDGLVYRMIPKYNVLVEGNLYFEKITDEIPYRELKPSEYIFYKVRDRKQSITKKNAELQQKYKKEAEKLPEDKRANWILRQPTIPQDPLVEASELVYAEVKGSNLQDLFSLPEIDKNRTTCNNMHVITSVFGIEAARTYVIKALYDNITNYGSYVSPANILFIAEFITSRDVPSGATYTGISRQKGGHLSLATIERAGQVFTKSAIYGKKENIKNVSASIVVGARVAIGDGAFDIAQDITTSEGEQKTIINDDVLKTFHDSMPPEVSEAEFYEELENMGYIPDVGYDATEGEGVSGLNLYDEEDFCPLDNPIFDKTQGPAKEGTEEATENIVYGIPSSIIKEKQEDPEGVFTPTEKPKSTGIMYPVSCEDENLLIQIPGVFNAKEKKEVSKIIKRSPKKKPVERIIAPKEVVPKEKEIIVSPLVDVDFDIPDISDLDLEMELPKKDQPKPNDPQMINLSKLRKQLGK